nr:hypothetical protein [Tanacetum cinerariifolium]
MDPNNPNTFDTTNTYDHYDVYFQGDYDQYMRDYEAYQHFVALCEQEAGGSSSGPTRIKTYIPREREDAEQRLMDDYFGDDEFLPKYPKENFRRRAPECPFVVNGHTYRKGYYLADGIYPAWSMFVKTFSVARDEKTLKFKRVQEGARKYIERAFRVLQGPYQLNTVTIPAAPATEISLATPEQTTVETILTIESMESYYSRFYKMMNEMIRNNLTVATMQVNVKFLQQLQPEWSRFVTIVKQQHDLDTVSYHKLFDVLKRYQKEVNKIRVERIAKTVNPLALVATARQYPDPYYQAPKSHKSYAPPSKQSSSTRSNASTKFKGKEIAKPITPPSESVSEEDSDPEQAQRDKDMQKNLALIEKYMNDNQTGQFGNQRTVTVAGDKETESRNPKSVKDSTYHKEKMLLWKQAEKGVSLQAEQADWLEDMDEETDEQELEAHYSFMALLCSYVPHSTNEKKEKRVVVAGGE